MSVHELFTIDNNYGRDVDFRLPDTTVRPDVYVTTVL